MANDRSMAMPTGGSPGLARTIAAWRPGAGTWLLFACLGYAVGAYLVSPDNYVAMLRIYLSEFGFYGPVLLTFGLLAAGPLLDPRRPVTAMVDLVRESGPTAALVVSAFILSLAAFTTFKLSIPEIVPFHGDRAFALLDRWMHFGEPWQHLHAIDPGWFATVVAFTYGKVWFVEWFGMVLFAAFCARQARDMRYLWALALTTAIIGTLLATLLSSVGPIFYEVFVAEARFTGLMPALAAHDDNKHVIGYADYLLQNMRNETPALGTGISAMPSMHVAIATLNALYLANISRWAGIAGWSFALIILFGSVYTGWHYAIDGYVSMLVVGVIWQKTLFLAAEWPRKPMGFPITPVSTTAS